MICFGTGNIKSWHNPHLDVFVSNKNVTIASLVAIGLQFGYVVSGRAHTDV